MVSDMYNMFKIVDTFVRLKEDVPSLRFCQFVSNVAKLGGWDDDDLFYCPDEIITKGLLELKK